MEYKSFHNVWVGVGGGEGEGLALCLLTPEVIVEELMRDAAHVSLPLGGRGEVGLVFQAGWGGIHRTTPLTAGVPLHTTSDAGSVGGGERGLATCIVQPTKGKGGEGERVGRRP